MIIELRAPGAEFEDSFLAGQKEMSTRSDAASWVYLGDDADLVIPERDFPAYVKMLHLRQTQPPAKFVADTTYWAINDGEMVGRISIRHELNEFLRNMGGHIGYVTRPSARGKGVASQMLAAILQTGRAKALGKVLLTCDVTNLASQRTIVKNGGKLSGMYTPPDGRPTRHHYWITTA